MKKKKLFHRGNKVYHKPMEECDKKFLKVIGGSFIGVMIVIVLFSLAFYQRAENIKIQREGIDLYTQGKYVEAINKFEELNTINYDCRDYGDVDYYYEKCLEELKQQEIKTCPSCGYEFKKEEK